MNRVCLVILDGWGHAPHWGGNPIALASPKTFNSLWRVFPRALLDASGKNVGLPGHEAGNSEVGHLSIGGGRIVHLDQVVITQSIRDGSFFNNSVLLEAFHRARKLDAAVHIMGLMSDGGVHSSLDHLYALLELASRQEVDRVFLHMFADGRDAAPQSALNFLERVEQALSLYKVGEFATVSGRFFAMDRDHHDDRVEKVIEAMTGAGGPRYESARQAISLSYKQGLSDEYIVPSVVMRPSEQPVGVIKSQDSVIFFNFRADRARQIVRAILKKMPDLYFVTFVPYTFSETEALPVKAAFKPNEVENSLTQVLSQVGVGQFHIAETEKYAHVTYFFNGGFEDPFPAEERLLVPSPAVASFALAPQMAAQEISSELLKRLKKSRYGFSVVNFANADMVGHTGDVRAAIAAIQTLDNCIKQVVERCQKEKIFLVITADHGNVEQMISPASGEVDTEHSTNPVPFILVAPKDSGFYQIPLHPTGILADVAPTILAIMGLTKPNKMTGLALTRKMQ